MIVSHKHKFVFIHIPKNGGTSVRRTLVEYTDLVGMYTEASLQDLRGEALGLKQWRDERREDFSAFELMHPFAKEVKWLFTKNNWDWDDYYKFAVVRNPWDRQVSWFNFLKKLYPVEGFGVDTFEEYVENNNGGFGIALRERFALPLKKNAKGKCKMLTDLEYKSPKKLKEKIKRKTTNIIGMNMAGALPLELDAMFPADVLTLLEDSSQDKWITDQDGNDLVDAIIRFENFQEDFSEICKTIGIPKVQISHINKTVRPYYINFYNDTTKKIVAKKEAKIIKRFGYEFGK